MFERPASASGITWEEHKGQLLLIEPKSVETGVSTTFGEKDAVRADITVIDAPNGAIEYHDALIFPGVLIGQTRSMVGKKVLGRLGQGAAKPGQKPPWRLDDPTDADIQTATAWVTKRETQQIQAPQEANPPF